MRKLWERKTSGKTIIKFVKLKIIAAFPETGFRWFYLPPHQ